MAIVRTILHRTFGRLALIIAVVFPGAARAATYTYEVNHAVYGVIGIYTRSSGEIDGGARAEAHLDIVVKVLGVTLRREASNQIATWRGQRLVSFQSQITTNGRKSTVNGVADGDRFVVTTPSGK